MRYQDIHVLVLVLCPDPHMLHSGKETLPPIRYILIFDKHGKCDWWDDPTWKQYRMFSNQVPWAEAKIVFAQCPNCEQLSKAS